MTTYTLYFEFFGKKLKTTVQVETEYQAKQQVINRIKFEKIINNKSEPKNPILDFLNGFK